MNVSNNELLSIVIEDAYGTDPLSGADPTTFLAPVRGSVSVKEVMMQVDDPSVFATRATREGQTIGDYVEVSFQIPLTGKSGAAGTAPNYVALLEACGLVQTVNASTNVELDPNPQLNATDGDTSFTLVYYEFDDETSNEAYEHRITGCRGNLRIILEQGQPAILEFVGAGLYADPPTSTSTPPTNPTSYQGDKNFLVVQGVTHTIGGTAAKFRSITIDLGWQVGQERCGNGAAATEEIYLYRDGAFCMVEYDLQGNSDVVETWVGAIKDATTYALVCSLTDGTDTVAITGPVLQPRDWTPNRGEGRKGYTINAQLHGNFGTSDGNDFFQMTYT